MIKSCICLAVLVLWINAPLQSQDIESQLSGSSSGQGFTVKAGGGSPLFTVRGDGRTGVGILAPTAQLHVAGVDGFLVTGGTNSQGTLPASGIGARMMWYPKKRAFRAGYVDGAQWNDVNIGEYSSALGNCTTAGGSNSTALGYYTTAAGSYSVAIGYMTIASNTVSIAMGDNCIASGHVATAMGSYTTASGAGSTATGYQTIASGLHSTAMGAFASTNGKTGAFMIGDESTSTSITASGNNVFGARFAGGYSLYSNSGLTTGVFLGPGANSWSQVSDSTRKENFTSADGDAVLQGFRSLRLGSWNYRGQDPAVYRHYGPMAQEWFTIFGHDGVGTIGNDTTLASADVDGILCIAVQALEKRTSELREEMANVSRLRQRLTALEEEKAVEVNALRTQLSALQEEMKLMHREFANHRAQQQADAPRFRNSSHACPALP